MHVNLYIGSFCLAMTSLSRYLEDAAFRCETYSNNEDNIHSVIKDKRVIKKILFIHPFLSLHPALWRAIREEVSVLMLRLVSEH